MIELTDKSLDRSIFTASTLYLSKDNLRRTNALWTMVATNFFVPFPPKIYCFSSEKKRKTEKKREIEKFKFGKARKREIHFWSFYKKARKREIQVLKKTQKARKRDGA